MSQLEYTEEFEELEAADSSESLVTILIVAAGLCTLAAVILVLVAYGSEFGTGPFAQTPARGAINAVSDNGTYVSFTINDPERIAKIKLGDVFFVTREGGKQFVGRVVVERHPKASVDLTLLKEHWGIGVESSEFVGRVMPEYTVVDGEGKLSIQKDDSVSSMRPKGVRPVETK